MRGSLGSTVFRPRLTSWERCRPLTPSAPGLGALSSGCWAASRSPWGSAPSAAAARGSGSPLPGGDGTEVSQRHLVGPSAGLDRVLLDL